MVVDLNPTLRGWYGYFKHAHRPTFRRLDEFLRRRLRAWLRKQEQRPGFGRCHADHRRWPNHFFVTAGLFTLYLAWQTEKHSR
ncbi:MAG: group II intron maturase-specific domain-containing protein [Methylococcales bacterium]